MNLVVVPLKRRSFRWRRALMVVGLFLFGLLLACGGGGSNPTPTPVPTKGSIRVTNSSASLSMTELYVSTSGSSSWGPNQLSSLSAGASITINEMQPANYDLKAVWSNGTTASSNNITVSSGLTTYVNMTPSIPTTGSIRVTNGSGSYSMTELYLSPSGSSTWGSNQLSSSLSIGSAITFTQIPPGSWDVKSVWSNGSTASTYSQAVSGGLTTYVTMTPPAPTTGSMRVTNGSGSYSMTELYISPSGSSTWGSNQLSSSLSAGSAITVNQIPPGSWDVKAVWSSGGVAYTYSLTVSGGLTTYVTMTPPAPTTGSMRVTNGSGSYSMTELYISPSGSSSWGSNQLSSSLSAGSAITVNQIPPGSWDVKAVWSSGGVAYTYSLTVSGGLTTYVTMTPPAPTTGSMRVTNGSGSYSMTELYISPSGSSSWGSNQLSSSLSAGSAITVNQIPPGSWDVKAVWSSGGVAYTYSLTVSGGLTTYVTMTPPAPTTGSMRVTNGSGSYSMTELYISPSGSSSWGSNQLSSSLSAGSYITFSSVPPGSYDVKAVWSDGSSATQFGFSVTVGNTTYVTMTPSAPATGSMRVTNGSGSYSMTELYISPSSSSSWGPNQLSSSLPAGSYITFTGIPPGSWDVKSVWSNGSTAFTNSLTVSGGLTTYVTMTPPASTTGSMQVTNGSGSYSMTELYFSSGATWGSNQLSSYLSPYGNITFPSLPPGNYAVKPVWSDGSSSYGYTFSVVAGYTTNITMMLPGYLQVTNGSASYSMTGLYIRLSGSPTWTNNALSSSLAPGWNFFFTSLLPGNWDVMAVWSNGDSLTVYGSSLTTGNTTYINPIPAGGVAGSSIQPSQDVLNVSGPSPTTNMESAFKSTQEPLAEAKSETDVKVFIAAGDFGLPKDRTPTNAEGPQRPFQFALGPLGEIKSDGNLRVFTPDGGVSLPKNPLFAPSDSAIEDPQGIFHQGIAGEPKVQEIIFKAMAGSESSPSNIKR